MIRCRSLKSAIQVCRFSTVRMPLEVISALLVSILPILIILVTPVTMIHNVNNTIGIRTFTATLNDLVCFFFAFAFFAFVTGFFLAGFAFPVFFIGFAFFATDGLTFSFFDRFSAFGFCCNLFIVCPLIFEHQPIKNLSPTNGLTLHIKFSPKT